MSYVIGSHNSLTNDSPFLEGLVCFFSNKYEANILKLQEKDGLIDLMSTGQGAPTRFTHIKVLSPLTLTM